LRWAGPDAAATNRDANMAEAVKVRNEEDKGRNGGSVALPGAVTGVMAYPRRFRQFLHEVKVELSHVTWPTPTDVKATTVVVIVTVFFFGFFLFVVDRGVSSAVEWLFNIFKS